MTAQECVGRQFWRETKYFISKTIWRENRQTMTILSQALTKWQLVFCASWRYVQEHLPSLHPEVSAPCGATDRGMRWYIKCMMYLLFYYYASQFNYICIATSNIIDGENHALNYYIRDRTKR